MMNEVDFYQNDIYVWCLFSCGSPPVSVKIVKSEKINNKPLFCQHWIMQYHLAGTDQNFKAVVHFKVKVLAVVIGVVRATAKTHPFSI